MIELDEDALICDLAETYQIYDYRSLPAKLVATLSVGLRAESRIKMLASGMPVAQDTLLLATIADRVEMFRFGFSEGANKGKKPPASLVEALCGGARTNAKGVTRFKSADEFEQALARIRGK